MFAQLRISILIGSVVFGVAASAHAQTAKLRGDGTVTVEENNRTLWSIVPETVAAKRGEPVMRTLSSGGASIVTIEFPVTGREQSERWIGRRSGSRIQTLWHGLVGALDADGERSRVIEVGPTGLTLSYRVATIGRCDGPAKLFEQRLDFQTGQWTPVPPMIGGESAPLSASAQSPHALGSHPGNGFRFTAASDREGANGEVSRLDLPAELQDHDPTRAWVGSRGTTSVFFTARGPSSAGITGLRVFSSPNATHGGPTQLAVILGGKTVQRFQATLALSTEPLWLPLPTPVESGCLTVVASGFDPAKTPALGELEIFTRADGAEGLNFVLGRLQAGQGCDENLRMVMATLGDKASASLFAALGKATLAGQRCLVQGLSDASVSPPVTVSADSLAALVSVLKTLDPQRDVELERQTIAVLEKVGEPALVPLASWFDSVTHDELQTRRAARAMAAIRSPKAVDALLEKLRSDGVRLSVRGALAESRWPIVESVLAQVMRAEFPAPTETLVADRLWILARRVRFEPESRAAIAHAASLGLAATPFVVRARAIEVLSMLGDAPSATRLIDVLQKDPEPVLQMLAAQGLSMPAFLSLKGEVVSSAMFGALGAPDPRVREIAARWIGRNGPVTAGGQLLTAFASERWPFVRVGLVSAMGQRCPGNATQVLLASTRSENVDEKRASLVAMSACQPVDSRPILFGALEAEHESASVRSVAGRLLGEVGGASDATRLDAILGALAASGRLELDPVVGEVLASLIRLDRSKALPRALAFSGDKRLGLRRVAIESLGAICDPGAGAEALKLAAAGSDGWLASSARTALSRCEGKVRREPREPIDQP